MELARALEDRGFAPDAAREALDRLAAEGWLDDLSAARSAIRSRGGRYGKSRLGRELALRGFDRETVAAALSEIPAGREDEALARAFARLWKSHAALPLERRRQRVWNALARRGFAADRVSAIMKGSDEIG